MQQGTLILEDGSKFDGFFVFAPSTNTTGEVDKTILNESLSFFSFH